MVTPSTVAVVPPMTARTGPLQLAVSQVPAPVLSPSRIGGLASPGSGAIVNGRLEVVNPMFRIQLPM
jgi:hypothetical protein